MGAAQRTPVLRLPQFWLRLALMAFSIVAFALLAEWINDSIETVKTSSISFGEDGAMLYSSTGSFGIFPVFTLFSGIFSTVFCLCFIVLYVAGSPLGLGVFPIAVDVALIWIWLVCTVPMTTLVSFGNQSDTTILVGGVPAPDDFLDRATASMVFSWAAWVATVALIFVGCTQGRRNNDEASERGPSAQFPPTESHSQPAHAFVSV